MAEMWWYTQSIWLWKDQADKQTGCNPQKSAKDGEIRW